ncbi:hypothetical protein ACLKA6_015762 [Drosophila palustris]
MDNKKDIYNLWVQYTTKNDETYFREFVARFVDIWRSQLQLDFQSEQCPLWHEVRPDNGPHLGRLPDELLPAIGKFIIVARDACDQDQELTEQGIEQVAILIDCLVIICRHFDNILAIIKYEYKPNLIAILSKQFNQKMNERRASPAVTHLFRSFSAFLEVMYDPYLTWRSFLRHQAADYTRLPYKPHAVHVEIVPFIYDCFQNEELLRFAEIGESLLHVLGAVICGSQRNGMRAICPATVSIIMRILQQWESGSSLRHVALNCYALMVIVLQKSSPEERQIDLVTLIQHYCDALQQLLATKHFDSGDANFDITSDSDSDVAIDVNALATTVAGVQLFLPAGNAATAVGEAIGETNLLELLIGLPQSIKHWHVSHTSSLSSTMNSLAALTHSSPRSAEQLKLGGKIERLFGHMHELDAPSVALLDSCFNLGYNAAQQLLVLPEVMLQLLQWLPDLQEQEQLHVSTLLLKGCTDNYGTKTVACASRVVRAVCACLLRGETLSEMCVQTLIKLIEELSKLSIVPVELKCIFGLLREGAQFPQHKQLQQTLVMIALQSLRGSNCCSEYFAIEQPSDGITVPEIRNWISGSYGFIFHILVRFNLPVDAESSTRRMLLTLQTGSGGGFEVFVQSNGNLVVAALTRREYLTSATATKTLLDGQWHYLTVAVTPPKRPFSYSQINIFVDFVQKLSATLKVQAVNEPFTVCSIGAVVAPQPKHSEISKGGILPRSSSQESGGPAYKGMLPSLLERTLSANVSNYFTLPLRTPTAFDPNVKNFPIGMQDTVFGEQSCLQGHLGGVLLAEPTTSLKTIFDAGMNFSSIFSQDNDLLELNSRFVFCYAPGAVWHDTCQDLIPGGRYPGRINAQHRKTVKIQDTINSIGGINAILPMVHRLVKEQDADVSINSSSSDESTATPLKTPTADEFTDWEMLSSNSYTEWKMIQHPLASLLCLLRYLTHENENNQQQLLNSECLAIIGTMLQRCQPSLFDVNALMATHLLMESLQAHKSPAGDNQHQLMEALYAHIVFDFAIWSRLQFQITLGHAQYLSAMIKNDRKYFRRRYGILFILDVVRQYYSTPDNICSDDARTIRSTLFGIVRFYLQKDVNIKEVNVMIAFLASVRQELVLVEFLEMMTLYVRGKNCKDQMVLLLHEPQSANLIYNFFVDKSYSSEVQEAAIRFISGLLATSRVHQKYKQVLRLYDQSGDQSMFPGFFSFITPMSLSSTILFHLVDEMLAAQPDYGGLMFLVYHVSSCDLQVKLEIAKRLLQTTFVKQQSTVAIARQTGWQESIARLLIRKHITSVPPDEERRRSFGISMDVLLEDNSSFLAQADLITFSDQEINLAQLQQEQAQSQEEQSDRELILNEIQASVSEAATVIESEIKELAESVSGAVVENVNSVFSVLRQTTHDIQDTFESLTLGSSTDNTDSVPPASLQREESLSSDSSTQSPHGPTKKSDSLESTTAFDFVADGDVDTEEQLVYLVSNTLFNVFWRGIGNDHPQCWQERGQVLGCINLLALNNELITSHLSLRLRILEMAVQASLFDLSEHGSQTLINQENASHILRMVYELVVLGSNEDESKKCSTKLLDGVLALLDALMIFQQGSSDDWSDMIRLCLGLLLKCSHHPNPGIVAMATAKLHAILQSRSTEDPAELSYLLYSINRALDNAIEVGNPEEYSFLMPVMKALLEKCRSAFNLDTTLPDLPSTSSGPVFFNDFQMYSTSKKWRNFIERMNALKL